MSGISKAELRDAIFNSPEAKPQSRSLIMFGQQVEVRQPSLAQIQRISKAAAADEKTPAIVRIMCEYMYVPGTDERVFDAADAEIISTLPGGKWLNDLNKVIEELSGIDVKGAEKNSEETD